MIGFNATVVLPGSFQPNWLSGNKLWLRSDLGITLGTGVSAWADQSGNGHNATQATGANQPTYVASGGGNGNAYLSWAGASGSHNLKTAGVVIAAQPCEFFIAARSTQNIPTGGAYLLDLGGNQGLAFQPAGTNTVAQFWSSAVVNATTIPINSDFILDSSYNGASSTESINGAVATGPANPGSDASVTPATIGNYTGLSNEWGGFIYEICVYNRTLTAAERLEISRYMGTRYGITVP